jgi:chromosome segregation ATPase
MSANLTVVADIKAEVAALSAVVRELKATQPNLTHFAGEIGTHLIKFETGVTRSFTDQFAGNFFRATEATTPRVVNLEETQAKLETALSKHVKTYDEMLETHRKKVAKMLETHEKSISALLASNDKKLTDQQTTINRLLKELTSYDKHFVDLHNSALSLVESNNETTAQVDTAVNKYNEISTGPQARSAKGDAAGKGEEVTDAKSNSLCAHCWRHSLH